MSSNKKSLLKFISYVIAFIPSVIFTDFLNLDRSTFSNILFFLIIFILTWGGAKILMKLFIPNEIIKIKEEKE
jgi:hypothetical protein